VAYFPLFVNLSGRFCLLAGGGSVAARKARSLVDFGAVPVVVDPAPGEGVRSLERRGFLRVRERVYGGPGEIAGAALVVAATGDRELNRRIAADAGAAGIPVNVCDAPELCGFFFPALVKRGDLVAGISTSGLCPRLAARLRRRLDRLWPSGLGTVLERLGEERRRLRGPAGSAGSADPADLAGPARTIGRLDPLITRLLEEMDGTGENDETPGEGGS
jgi:siroheme synthase-like protein